MLSPVRNDCRIHDWQKSEGIALLVMLGIILIAVTASVIGHLSLNSIEQKNTTRTLESLAQARDAIMGFALTQASNAQPPGTLPCPDTDGDGKSNVSPAAVGGCISQQGLVPYVTLGLAVLVNGVITPQLPPLWYAIPAGYGGDAIAPFIPRNSSRASALMLNGQSMAFIVIASGKPFGTQNPPANPLAVVSNFLEPPNNGANPNYTYSDLNDLTHNDKLLGMPIGTFWRMVSGSVLAQVRTLLGTYHNQCGVYPWPVPYTPIAGNNSNNTIFEGRLPLNISGGITLPRPWGSACPLLGSPTSAPALLPWLATHWRSELYYAICSPNLPSPPAPVTANCLNLDGVVGAEARAIIMAPGIPLNTIIPSQVGRLPGSTLSNYFELTNNSINDSAFLQLPFLQHTATFNDLILVVP